MNLNTRHKNWLPSLIFSPLRRALQNPSPGQGEDQGEGPCKPRAMCARCVRNSARGVKVPAGERDPGNFLSDPHRLALRAGPPLPVWERAGESSITGFAKLSSGGDKREGAGG